MVPRVVCSGLFQHVDAHKAGGKPSFEQLDNLIQFANIANDEMDFGHGLELGLNLFNFDTLFRRDAANLLIPTYNLLNRSGWRIFRARGDEGPGHC